MTTTPPSAPGDPPPTITPSPASPVPPATPFGLSTRLTTAVLVSAAAVALVIVGAIGLAVGVLLSSDSKSTKVTIPSITPGTTAPPGPNNSSTSTTTTTKPPAPQGTVTLGAGVVNVPVPSGWTTYVSDDRTSVILNQNSGVNSVSVYIANGKTDVAAFLEQNADTILTDRYSQVQRNGVVQLPLQGSIKQAGLLVYTALYTSNGTSFSAAGGFFAVLRTDGTTLVVREESQAQTPQDAANDVKNADFTTIVQAVINDFASR